MTRRQLAWIVDVLSLGFVVGFVSALLGDPNETDPGVGTAVAVPVLSGGSGVPSGPGAVVTGAGVAVGTGVGAGVCTVLVRTGGSVAIVSPASRPRKVMKASMT